jgi:hypothetical protein
MHRAQGGRSNPAPRLAALLCCCLLLTACPSSGGDLLPVLQSEGGAQLESISFKNDTLSVTHNQVTIRARGSWSASDSNTSLVLEIVNAGPVPVTIAFDNCEMVNNDSHERLSLRSRAEDKSGAPVLGSDRFASIESGRTRKYYVDFFIKAADGRASVSRNVEGQTVMLRVPVVIENEIPALADFLFSFKYVEYQH